MADLHPPIATFLRAGQSAGLVDADLIVLGAKERDRLVVVRQVAERTMKLARVG